MERVQKIIEKAKNEVDYVVVCFHSHEIKGLTDEEPDMFIEEFCKACIDFGACAVIGSGTHEIKAVEIYKDKPIFYSIANFIFQVDSIEHLPDDFYEKFNISKDKTTKEALLVRSRGNTVGLTTDPVNYRGLIPLFEFEDNKLVKLLIKPIELGFEKDEDLKGLPEEADIDVTLEIYNRLSRLSKPYNTEFILSDNLIEVKL